MGNAAPSIVQRGEGWSGRANPARRPSSISASSPTCAAHIRTGRRDRLVRGQRATRGPLRTWRSGSISAARRYTTPKTPSTIGRTGTAAWLAPSPSVGSRRPPDPPPPPDVGGPLRATPVERPLYPPAAEGLSPGVRLDGNSLEGTACRQRGRALPYHATSREGAAPPRARHRRTEGDSREPRPGNRACERPLVSGLLQRRRDADLRPREERGSHRPGDEGVDGRPAGSEPFPFDLVRDLADRNRVTCDAYGADRLRDMRGSNLARSLSDDDLVRGVAAMQHRPASDVRREARPGLRDLGVA